jgi:hypothetical protein
MNIYGDEVVRTMVKSMSPEEQLETFGKTLFVDGHGDDISTLTAKKATGWLSMAPTDIQERFFTELEAEYTAYVDGLTAAGENKLITQDFDFQAETISKVKAFAGSDQSNPLTADSFIETMEVNVLKKPMSNRAGRDYIDEYQMKLTDRTEEYYQPKLDKLDEQIEANIHKAAQHRDKGERDKATEVNKETQKLQDRRHELAEEGREKLNTTLNILETLEIGAGYKIEEKSYDDVDGTTTTRVYTAVLTNISSKRTGSPVSMSNNILQFVTNDRSRQRIHLPLSKYMMQEVGSKVTSWIRPMDFVKISDGIPDNWEETQSKTDREQINMWTGNIFAAYTKIAGDAETLIRFTTKDGKIREGIVIKKTAKSDLVSGADREL